MESKININKTNLKLTIILNLTLWLLGFGLLIYFDEITLYKLNKVLLCLILLHLYYFKIFSKVKIILESRIELVVFILLSPLMLGLSAYSITKLMFYNKSWSKYLHSLPLHNLLKITSFFYSRKTQKEVFEPITLDWQEEYFEALDDREIWKSRWINVRYTYAFILAMIQKSPIGDLFEFILKIALKVAK